MARRHAKDRDAAAQIEALVEHFNENSKLLETVRQQLVSAVGGADFFSEVHSLRSRIKSADHLKDKLQRKLKELRAEGRSLDDITPQNLFLKVNDLVGLRILHLHTRQFEPINAGLQNLFGKFRYKCLEGPAARTWDDETRDYFDTLGVQTVKSPSLYTSVHYIVDAGLDTPCTAEIQVRTLAEELWGEVDHSINYPHKTSSLACREQIKALARATSSCSRLVDSIYRSHEDFLVNSQTHPKAKKGKS
jgi:ppGpp synthetase/RelA/SpoT-type nucleotidyltranferase